MEYLQTLLEQSEMPVITAFLLGLLTAVSPCPLATNITAIGFIGKDMANRNRMFASGILYTVGRIVPTRCWGPYSLPSCEAEPIPSSSKRR